VPNVNNPSLALLDGPINQVWIAANRENARTLLSGRPSALWELPYQPIALRIVRATLIAPCGLWLPI
jgi:hypothetical protein